MNTCQFFTDVGARYCAKGVDYQRLAGGGAFYMVLRLPCLPITNRRGEQVKVCAQHSDNEKEPA
ncbi:MAG: hypothetical protein JWR07_5456 [Nevskia sp.]|nr:hypothetical protein [Nevskia sp.]